MTDIPKLDIYKPSIGSIQPEYNGAQWQDGDHFFAGNGTYLFSERGGKRYTVGAAKAAPSAPATAPQQPQPAPTGTNTASPNPGDDTTGNSDDEVDFELWALGTKKYAWFKVKAAADAQFGDKVDTSGKAALIKSLKDIGALPS